VIFNYLCFSASSSSVFGGSDRNSTGGFNRTAVLLELFSSGFRLVVASAFVPSESGEFSSRHGVSDSGRAVFSY
jgi:hypothetical protein